MTLQVNVQSLIAPHWKNIYVIFTSTCNTPLLMDFWFLQQKVFVFTIFLLFLLSRGAGQHLTHLHSMPFLLFFATFGCCAAYSVTLFNCPVLSVSSYPFACCTFFLSFFFFLLLLNPQFTSEVPVCTLIPQQPHTTHTTLYMGFVVHPGGTRILKRPQ